MNERKLCVDCGEILVKRINSEGDQFWGCVDFPECRYTEDYENED